MSGICIFLLNTAFTSDDIKPMTKTRVSCTALTTLLPLLIVVTRIVSEQKDVNASPSAFSIAECSSLTLCIALCGNVAKGRDFYYTVFDTTCNAFSTKHYIAAYLKFSD